MVKYAKVRGVKGNRLSLGGGRFVGKGPLESVKRGDTVEIYGNIALGIVDPEPVDRVRANKK
ncbi:hypothetical protein A2Z33_01670 [Candidatus Gottesmanbacteria bacterium RBG_16_52_11]|uniref:Uncharacterized protein n=1 Tax=Candidatus Gottesmanbacteria bacterium RBG_16_52_11 TaxID=1798374 RepID=A0A1F5YPL8_9BACT|nr:MAG: hypothetical protein A2Z33_01670 [Candidatus Gottesmanbacteria bacterium RBG_16_52_11]